MSVQLLELRTLPKPSVWITCRASDAVDPVYAPNVRSIGVSEEGTEAMRLGHIQVSHEETCHWVRLQLCFYCAIDQDSVTMTFIQNRFWWPILSQDGGRLRSVMCYLSPVPNEPPAYYRTSGTPACSPATLVPHGDCFRESAHVHLQKAIQQKRIHPDRHRRPHPRFPGASRSGYLHKTRD